MMRRTIARTLALLGSGLLARAGFQPRFRRAAAVAALTLATCAALPAAGPLETLRARDQLIRRILSEGGETARLREAVNGIFDYGAHARESFGRHWDQMTERDRKEALRLVTALLERSSMDKVQDYRTNAIRYVAERIEASNPSSALVSTRVVRDREEWEVEYRMRLADGQWRIVDVLVEGASTVENNRATFYKEIRASGIEGLLGKLRRKVDRP